MQPHYQRPSSCKKKKKKVFLHYYYLPLKFIQYLASILKIHVTVFSLPSPLAPSLSSPHDRNCCTLHISMYESSMFMKHQEMRGEDNRKVT